MSVKASGVWPKEKCDKKTDGVLIFLCKNWCMIFFFFLKAFHQRPSLNSTGGDEQIMKIQKHTQKELNKQIL